MIDQLITSHWSSYGHRFLNEDDGYVKCLTCGALYQERIVDSDRCECDVPPCECDDPDACTCGGCQCSTYVEGEYLNGCGSNMIAECTGDTGMAHGYHGERYCDCEELDCPHVTHNCDCCYCG
jgi:hypothetical protein